MNEQALMIPRRFAIAVLHEAQIAQPQPIRGWVSARDGQPVAFHGDAAPGAVWAQLWSCPLAPAVPSAQELQGGGLNLVISLNTKGVLEMRAWELRDGVPHERVLKIHD